MFLNPMAMPFVPVSRYVGNNMTNPQKMRDGTIRFRLQTDSWLDIAASRAVKLWNVNLSISLAISPDGGAVAVSHPNCFLLQDESTKLSAFDSTGWLGYVYSRDDITIMSNFTRYCIWESGYSEPLNRFLSPEESLDENRDFVGALFAREMCAEAGDLETSSPRHLTYHNFLDDLGIVERCHVYGYEIVQDVTGDLAVDSPQEDIQIRFSPYCGLVLVSTPTLLVHVRSDQESVLLHTEDLRLFNRKRKLCARRTMYMAGINATSFFCHELFRPISYMYAL